MGELEKISRDQAFEEGRRKGLQDAVDILEATIKRMQKSSGFDGKIGALQAAAREIMGLSGGERRGHCGSKRN